VIGITTIASLLLQMSGQAALGALLFRGLLTAIGLGMLVQYAVELWLFFTGRGAALRRRIRASPISNGEGGPPVSVRDRLLFSWPFLVLGFGFFAYLLWTH